MNIKFITKVFGATATAFLLMFSTASNAACGKITIRRHELGISFFDG